MQVWTFRPCLNWYNSSLFSTEFADVWVQVPEWKERGCIALLACHTYYRIFFAWCEPMGEKQRPSFFFVTLSWLLSTRGPEFRQGFFLVVGGVVLMSVRELIVSRVNIDINTIRRRSSRRARQHKGVQSAEVNLWKRLMWVEKEKCSPLTRLCFLTRLQNMTPLLLSVLTSDL